MLPSSLALTLPGLSTALVTTQVTCPHWPDEGDMWANDGPVGARLSWCGARILLTAVGQHLTYFTGPVPFSPYTAGVLCGAYAC